MTIIPLLLSLVVSGVQAADAPAATPKTAKSAKTAKSSKNKNSAVCAKLQQRWTSPHSLKEKHEIWASWVANCPGTPDSPVIPVEPPHVPTEAEKRCAELDRMLSGADAMQRDSHLAERKKIGCQGTPPKGKDY